MVTCNKDCRTCKSRNAQTDDKGFPWSWECMKYGDTVFQSEFANTKTFDTGNTDYTDVGHNK